VKLAPPSPIVLGSVPPAVHTIASPPGGGAYTAFVSERSVFSTSTSPESWNVTSPLVRLPVAEPGDVVGSGAVGPVAVGPVGPVAGGSTGVGVDPVESLPLEHAANVATAKAKGRIRTVIIAGTSGARERTTRLRVNFGSVGERGGAADRVPHPRC
jgi:hypothetical protein